MEVGANNLRKVTFLLEEITDKEFKWSIAIDILWDKVDMIKSYKVGDNVKAYLNFRASEYNGKHFNRITAWKIEAATGGDSSSSSASKETQDDLPF